MMGTYMLSFNSGGFWEGCFSCMASVWSWLGWSWFSIAGFVLLLNYKFIWFHHYHFTVALIHVHLTYANSTISVCWKIISFFFFFLCNIPLNISQTHFFWVSTKETAICSNSTGKAGSIGLCGENAVLGKPHVLYCVVYLNNFQGSFCHSPSPDFRSQAFRERWRCAICCDFFGQIYRM